MPRRPENSAKKHVLTVHVKRAKKKAAPKASAPKEDEIERILAQSHEVPLPPPVPAASIRGQEERNKRLVMWSGVVFIMLVILVVWGFNVRREFNKIAAKNGNKDSEWETLSNELKAKMEDMKQGLESIKAISANEQNGATSTATSTAVIATSTVTDGADNSQKIIPSLPAAALKDATTTAASSTAEIEKLKTILKKLK